jgi:chromosome segregation ATPase
LKVDLVHSFVPGSIVRVQLKKFVTYDFVEFRPGPYLNMILGPNGTGKSSIACALCLGLNFPPSVLGRAAEVSSFVKDQQGAGHIELELKGPRGQPNIVVRRELFANSKTTKFTINGKSASGAQVSERIGALNIQVGNLW